MQETIEVEKTVTEEETLQICDDCGRELDEGGKTFKESNTFSDGMKLHFCSRCLGEYDNYVPEQVELVEEWLDERTGRLFKFREKMDFSISCIYVLLFSLPVIAFLSLHNGKIMKILTVFLLLLAFILAYFSLESLRTIVKNDRKM